MSSQITICAVADYLPIDKLQFHPNNPRRIRPDRLELLKDSIVEKGFYQPILVWKKKNIVLAGNHRLLAVQELIRDGYEFVTVDGKKKNHLPVVIEDVSDDIAEAILFETNNPYAEWVEEKLREAIVSIEESGRSPLKYGFEQSEVDRLLANAIKDADEVVDKLHDLDPEDDAEEPDLKEGERLKTDDADDAYEALMVPKVILEQFTHILQTTAKAIDSNWGVGDSYEEAFKALIESIHSKKCIDWIKSQVEK